MLVRSFHAAAFFSGPCHRHNLANLLPISECSYAAPRIFSSLSSHLVRKYSTKLLSTRLGSANKSQKERASRKPAAVFHTAQKLSGDRSIRSLKSTGRFNDIKSTSRIDYHKRKSSLEDEYENELGRRVVRSTESMRRQGLVRHLSQKMKGERVRKALKSERNLSIEEAAFRPDSQVEKQSFRAKYEDQQHKSAVSSADAANFSKEVAKPVKKYQTTVKSNVNTERNSTDSRKKGKKVMRLDPTDNTSKRFSRGYPYPGEDGIDVDEQSRETTGRAQFRAIIPQAKLMQHIEKHLLGRRRPSELQKAGYDLSITPAPLDNVPFSKKKERQPTQEEVFRHKLRFTASATVASSFPPCEIPEVAFAGRSNVGKSSLINALTRQWGVARTSDKPGLTQSINFYRLGGRICLVDLPGYGFAYAKEEKKESWEELVREFVTTRVGLKRVYLLVDAKWGLKLRDEELIELMERAGTKYQIVLTKSDTVPPVDLGRRATQIQELFKKNKSFVLPMMMVSSKTGEGLEFFRGYMAKLAKASLI